MTITAGMTVPSVEIHTKTKEGLDTINTAKYCEGRKVVLFSVPGAFTPTCSAKHMPGFVEKFDQLIAKGVDAVACLAVNDAHAMLAWSEEQDAVGKIDMFADPRCDFSKALGIDRDMGSVMGIRAARCAFIIDDGMINNVFMEEIGVFDVSSVENILNHL
tara:strand:- start:365 stop:844 length:480 start_codon:yes stop_codon:yes gene_type:complete